MSLRPAATVGKRQAPRQRNAKESANYRFEALYDKVYGSEVLAYAYERCRDSGGVAGGDGQAFADIAA
jgi:hypothetical protein